VLAEVSDKIPSVWFFWCFHLAGAAVVLVLTRLSRRRAALVLLLPVAVAWALVFAYDALLAEDPPGDVTREMGRTYPVQQAAAALLPAGAVVGGVSVKRKRNEDQGFPVLPPTAP
jgi:hypothetical protein